MFSLKDLPAIKEWLERATQEFGGQAKEWTKQQIPKLLNLYPPYLGAGIRVTGYDNSHTWFDVEMELTPWNRNYVGVHFGGSLYSMCDPFFMMILMHNLGNDFVVWDRAAEIQFKRPGQTKVFARFEITPAEIESLANEAKEKKTIKPVFRVDVVDEQNKTVARVFKTVYVKYVGDGPRHSRQARPDFLK